MVPTEGLASEDPADTAESSLTERDRRILDFEREWVRHAGAKDDAVREQFGLSAARYYQVLNAVIDSPAAIMYDPMLVRRLQRMRDARTNARTLLRRHGTDLSSSS